MKHGAGGRAMRRLIQDIFVGPTPANVDGIGLAALDDGAAIHIGDGRYLVLTTDSHVVHPLFFPGGDIGRLAIAGTVNDLAMMGGTEVVGLTFAAVIEEGFPLDTLRRIMESVRATCAEAGVAVVTGDTKVMGKGEIDGVVLNTAGAAITRRVVGNTGLVPGDRLIVTGTLGDHGFAVLAARSGLELVGELRSDTAPLGSLVRAALAAGGDGLVAMKDPTRGGLASALHEFAGNSGVGIVLEQAAIPISAPVRAASELLGIDPLVVANEGKAVLAVRPAVADAVLAALRGHPLGREAAMIGICTEERPRQVILDTGFGRRLLAEPEGEPTPRIC
jgi:hydrogenase expression/formation protein HypE